MKLSKSKLALAKVINENGGWADGSEICSYNKHIRQCVFYLNGFRAGGFDANPFHNWHQCALSREEYHQAYPNVDADGWIEWNGGECPVSGDDIVDVAYSTYGAKLFSAAANSLRWSKRGLGGDIIAYRLHKPEVKPEFCESVMRSIPDPESKPTIEQLAHDYRNKLDFANGKRKEADAAKDGADAILKALEIAAEDLGFKIEPITTKQDGL